MMAMHRVSVCVSVCVIYFMCVCMSVYRIRAIYISIGTLCDDKVAWGGGGSSSSVLVVVVREFWW